MTPAADSLPVGWLQTVAAFQILGVLLTAASVAGALWVILVRDPALARKREQERDDERLEAVKVEQAQLTAEARAVLVIAERVRFPVGGASPGVVVWMCGVRNLSRSVVTDVTVTVSAVDENDLHRLVTYEVTDPAANFAFGHVVGAGGRVTPEEAADLTANLEATKRENFARSLSPDATSAMLYNVSGLAAENQAVVFTVEASWTDLRRNRWSRRANEEPELKTGT